MPCPEVKRCIEHNQTTLKTTMKIQSIALATVFATFVSVTAPTNVLAAGPEAQGETINRAFAHPIANVTGKTLTALVVTYAPGGKTSPHRHGQAFVVGYVLEGAIRSKIDNGKAQVFHAGESWTEKPGVHHTVSENASDTKPAKLLALFVADTKDKNLVIVDKK
jgi:quercetin dioxygenase-like cupin family protein